MKNKSLTPEIRFKGYEDEWTFDSFSNVFTLLKNNTLSRAYLSNSIEGVKNVHYGDILIKFGAIINGYTAGLPSILQECEPTISALTQLIDGDIIFADTAEDSAVGKCSEIRQINNLVCVSGLHTIPVRPILRFANFYLGYFLNSPAYHNTLLPFMQGTKVLSISKSAIAQTNISYPTHSEQSKLGDLFNRIDIVISETEREISRLEKMKAASLQKMFPRPGETTPEIRIGSFDGEWQIRTIGSCFSEASERGGFQNLLSVGITRGVYPTEDFIKTVTVKDFSNYKTVHANDIVYNSMRMWQGASGVSRYDGIVSPAYTVMTPREFIWSPFFAVYFKLPWVIKVFEANSQGLTKDTWNLKYPAISQIELAVPVDEKEQIYIAHFFDNLDALIDLKRRKLTKLKNLKQSCLDKMFVNITAQ